MYATRSMGRVSKLNVDNNIQFENPCLRREGALEIWLNYTYPYAFLGSFSQKKHLFSWVLVLASLSLPLGMLHLSGG